MKKRTINGILIMLIVVPFLSWAMTVNINSPLPQYLYDIARLSALLGFSLILFQFILSSKIKFIEREIGLDKLFVIHKRIGKIWLILILMHPILLYTYSVLQGYIAPYKVYVFLGLVFTDEVGLLKVRGLANAYFVFLGFILVISTAILYGRLQLLTYETWKKIHYASYLLLPLVFVHSIVFGSDLQKPPLRMYWFFLFSIYIILLFHRVWKYVNLRRNPYQVTNVVKVTHDTWNLSFKGMPLDYKPGQFMIVQFTRNGKISEPHPFTISSSPSQEELFITIKESGDLTSAIGETKIGSLVYIDAPYGVFSFVNRESDNLIFMAGGIGITPFMSMLRNISEKNLKKNVLLLYGNKTEKDIIFYDELQELSTKISLKVVHILSRDENWPSEKGRIDELRILKYVEDLQIPQFYLCGPPPMMASIKKILLANNVLQNKIHYEEFSLR